jgi:hypothetical protein
MFNSMKPEYLGPSYNVLDKNCNHFTSRFLRKLTGKDLPPYVDRIMKVCSLPRPLHRASLTRADPRAQVARKVRPCLPTMFKEDLRNQQAPPEYDNHRRAVPQPRDHRVDEQTPAASAATAGAAPAAASAT